MKRYLFFVSLSYAYPILRPIQSEIWRRGDDVAWFFTSPCDQYLQEGEKQLKTIKEVIEYNPIAVFAPGNKVHVKECDDKLSVLLEQRRDLILAINQLLEDIETGRKYMKVYKQMKMYNDPELNPVLYRKGQGL